jgi:hypothetical protein
MTTRQREVRQYTSEISERTDVRAGSPLPLGTQGRAGWVNFALFSHVQHKSSQTDSNSLVVSRCDSSATDEELTAPTMRTTPTGPAADDMAVAELPKWHGD